jgi:hypothetical protein
VEKSDGVLACGGDGQSRVGVAPGRDHQNMSTERLRAGLHALIAPNAYYANPASQFWISELSRRIHAAHPTADAEHLAHVVFTAMRADVVDYLFVGGVFEISVEVLDAVSKPEVDPLPVLAAVGEGLAVLGAGLGWEGDRVLGADLVRPGRTRSWASQRLSRVMAEAGWLEGAL